MKDLTQLQINVNNALLDLTQTIVATTKAQEEAQAAFYQNELDRIEDLKRRKTKLQTEVAKDQMSRDLDVEEYKINLLEAEVNKQKKIENKAFNDGIKAQLKIHEKAVEAALKKEQKRRKKANKKMTDAEIEEFKQHEREKFKYTEEMAKKYEKRAATQQHYKDIKDKARRRREADEEFKELQSSAFGKGHTFQERIAALKTMYGSVSGDGGGRGTARFIMATGKMLSNLSQQLDAKVDEIANNKAAIDTRLYGSVSNKNSKNWTAAATGSQWEAMSKLIISLSGISPFIKQSDLTNKVKSFVSQGISFNVTQRAYLDTIKDKIATTFNAADGTLLRLVRIQQQDTTASRLGMEAALTAFLNNMYETTEYMSDIMSSVKTNIAESMALMSAKEAVGFEYQVQKWMGSMYSVGMSREAVTGITSALGKLAAGDIGGITEGGTGNLMVMAANKAGLSISEILAKGLDDSSTNKLLLSMVDYLADIYKQAEGNLVVQQQLANVYGVKASDLKAILNLAGNRSTMYSINANSSTYDESINTLRDRAASMWTRTGVSEMITNVWDNVQYSLASGMANNVILYALQKGAGLLDDLAGGIPIPFVSAVGTGVDLETSVADLMRSGAFMGSAISVIAKIAAGMSGGGGPLKALGITDYSSNTVRRGGMVDSNGNLLTLSHSESGIIQDRNTLTGNNNSDDIMGAEIGKANDTKQAAQTDAQDTSEEATTTDINNSIQEFIDLFKKVVDEGTESIKVTFGGFNSDSPWGSQ